VGGPGPKRALAGVSLTVVLAAALGTLAVGAILKRPCDSGNWGDGRQYSRLCYTDIIPLYGTERLTGGRLPYLNPCPPEAGAQCDEYPVLTMYLMRVAAWLGHTYQGFYYSNVILLTLCALFTALALYRIAGERALYFALAPTLLIYAFVNWDLLAVALATAATLAYLRGRDELSGAMLGLGAAAKFYPALFLIPFVLGRLRERRRGGAVLLVVWSAVAYAAVNLAFLLAARHAWFNFFRFNANRPVDWDSLWFVACTKLGRNTGCRWSPKLINALSLGAFICLASLIWWRRWARHPDFARWTFGFPLLVAFLLTNKVYSPQYGLWLLPWFALSLPNAALFAAFEVADVFVFVTRFSWFGRHSGHGGASLRLFQIALIIRAAVLVGCLVAWVLRKQDEPLPTTTSTPQASLAGRPP